MEDLGGIIEERRIVEGEDSIYESENDSIRQGSTKRKRSRKRRNSGLSQGSAQPPPNVQVRGEGQEGNESSGEYIQQQTDHPKQNTSLTQEDYQARFYADYRKVADEYDKEFIKKYDEDLNTTLIFAGLFSAVTSAFIVEVDSQLKPDSGDETAALLRVLIYEINKTAFGDNVPSLPQWSGPPSAMIHVQALLFASLVVSLFSAFLAMLGKQWLNRYASTNMRGSAVERSQNRQRKLDGIVAWYFDHVMESLPLMLQTALLLLSCALSRYLWDISIIIASVVICVTSFGAVFYFFITIAGAAFESCPYQTPGSRILRYLGPKLWRTIRSALLVLKKPFGRSRVVGIIMDNAEEYHPWWSRREIVPFLGNLVLEVPFGLAVDVYRSGRAAIRVLSALPVGGNRLVRSTNHRLHSVYSTLYRKLGQQTIPPDFRCVSWTLQTSLDKPIHLTASEHLAAMTELTGLDPTLIADCFNVFVGCVSISDGELVVMRGLEQLATVSAGCLFRAFHHLLTTNPASRSLADLRRRYTRVFPFETNFRGLPFHHNITMIHALAHQRRDRCNFQWDNYRPSGQEHIAFARHMVEFAQVEYQRVRRTLGIGRGRSKWWMQLRKVPRWILRFALHSLSLDTPISVVADCLTIVAIDLDCDVSNIATLDESARVNQVSSLIIQKLNVTVDAPIMDKFFLQCKSKAIATLFSYAVRLEQGGQQEMVDAIFRAARASELILQWPQIRRHATALLDKSSPSSLNRVIILMSPYISWDHWLGTQNAVARWAMAASLAPYSEEVSQSVVDALLWVSGDETLRLDIPVDMWARLKRRTSLPPLYRGQSNGSQGNIVNHVRGLEDVEILKSYLLLVWSEWHDLWPDGLREMEISIRKDFGGIGMWCHRDDLVKHLDHVQLELDRGLEHFERHNPWVDEDKIKKRKGRYGHLKNVLLEVDKTAMETLTQSHTGFTCSLFLPCL